MAERLSHLEFVTRAITGLRAEGKKGIHSVFSGFNEAFRKYYDEDPVGATNDLQEDGHIVIRPSKKGVTLYLATEAPASLDKVTRALDKILGEDA